MLICQELLLLSRCALNCFPNLNVNMHWGYYWQKQLCPRILSWYWCCYSILSFCAERWLSLERGLIWCPSKVIKAHKDQPTSGVPGIPPLPEAAGKGIQRWFPELVLSQGPPVCFFQDSLGLILLPLVNPVLCWWPMTRLVLFLPNWRNTGIAVKCHFWRYQLTQATPSTGRPLLLSVQEITRWLQKS